MKKYLFAAAALLFSVSVSAQDAELLTVTPEEDNMTVSIAGFDIKLGPSAGSGSSRRGLYTEARGFSPVNIGLTTFMGEDETPEIRIPRSWYMSADIASFGIHGRAKFSPFFDTGIRLSHYNYRLDDGRAFTITDNGVPAFIDGTVYDKSKFKLTYLGVPVTLGMRLGHDFKISATASFDILVDARNKVKAPKIKTQLYDLNPYRTSVELAIHGNDCGIFVNYGLTSMFKESSGMDTHTLSIGIRLLD